MGLFPTTQYATYVQEGLEIDYTNATGNDIPAGTPIILGTFVGITLHDMPATTPNFTGAVAIQGVFDVIKSPPSTFALGDHVEWDNSLHYAISQAEAGYTVSAGLGKCVKATASAADQTVRVLLNPFTVAATG